MTVKLIQLSGKTRRRGKIVEETRPVFRVFLEDDYVGMVGEKPGSKFLPSTHEISDEEMKQILGAIGDLHKEEATAVPGAPVDRKPESVVPAGPVMADLEIVDESEQIVDESNEGEQDEN